MGGHLPTCVPLYLCVGGDAYRLYRLSHKGKRSVQKNRLLPAVRVVVSLFFTSFKEVKMRDSLFTYLHRVANVPSTPRWNDVLGRLPKYTLVLIPHVDPHETPAACFCCHGVGPASNEAELRPLPRVDLRRPVASGPLTRFGDIFLG